MYNGLIKSSVFPQVWRAYDSNIYKIILHLLSRFEVIFELKEDLASQLEEIMETPEEVRKWAKHRRYNEINHLIIICRDTKDTPVSPSTTRGIFS